MTHKLYNELAVVYDEMYRTIFNYDEDFERFKKELDEHDCKTVAEIGCGSGHLGIRFLKDGRYEYIGVDLSESMIELCYKNNPDCEKDVFKVGDMRKADEVLGISTQDAVMITGRTFTCMTTNIDATTCLKSVWKVLKPNGVVIFDNFDAKEIFLKFKGHFEQKAEFETRKYTRKSTTKINLSTGFTWDWHAKYIIEEEGKETKEIEDDTILRAFCEEELQLLLQLCGFEVIKMDDSKMLFTVARKK